jgi:hypothetical protein
MLRKARVGAASGQTERDLDADAVADSVWTVNVELLDAAPGVMEAGAKVAVAPVGNPEAESATALAKLPFWELTVMV